MRNLIHGLFQIDKIFYSGVTIPIIRSYRVWIATWWTKALLSISNSADPVFEAMYLTQSSSWSYQHSTLWKIEEWRDPHLIGVNDRVQRRSSAKLNGDVPCQEVAIDDSIICNCYIVVKVWAMFVIEGPAPWANWRPSPILMDERLGLVPQDQSLKCCKPPTRYCLINVATNCLHLSVWSIHEFADCSFHLPVKR